MNPMCICDAVSRSTAMIARGVVYIIGLTFLIVFHTCRAYEIDHDLDHLDHNLPL